MHIITTITEIKDFFDFNYHHLHPTNKFFDIFSQPIVPFLVVFLYLILSKPIINIIISLFNIKPDSKLLKYGKELDIYK